MSHLSKIFTQQPIDVPNRSGFDMSFETMGTGTTGTLIPLLCEETMPNETYSLGHLTQITLPPMATNFYGRIDFRIEAFFVPMRILWHGWENFFTMPFNNPFSAPVLRPTNTPFVTITIPESGVSSWNSRMGKPNAEFGPGSLSDYLGYKVRGNQDATKDSTYVIPNLLPFMAYHKIYDDWYRNKLIQKPVFVNQISFESPAPMPLYNFPWFTSISNFFNISFTSANSIQSFAPFNLGDGVNIFNLRQRNWAKDTFTTAALYPQASGDVLGSTVEFDTSGSTGEISIPALRNANVLQRWMDRNNVAGFEYADQIKAHYGVLPSDALVNRAIFLGSDIIGVYNRSVYSTSSLSEGGIPAPKNPFTSLATEGAATKGFKDGSLINNFKTTEHGYLVVFGSLVPHAQYSTGTRRYLSHSKRGDFPVPLLQGLGEVGISQFELSGGLYIADPNSTGTPLTNIFGYQQQYYEAKYHDDEVHGLLSDGETLESFALQRSFPANSSALLTSSFLQIPRDFLDQVQAASTVNTNFSYWYDVFFSFKKVSPLSEYVIPTLGDLKNTHKESIPYRGRQL